MAAKDAVGRYGEDVAARHLAAAGYEVLERNWRCRSGELDIVARHGDLLCFVEVKTRRGADFGGPADAVTPAKARRIRALAAAWLADRLPSYGELRFDVVGVRRSRSGPAQVEHLEGAF